MKDEVSQLVRISTKVLRPYSVRPVRHEKLISVLWIISFCGKRHTQQSQMSAPLNKLLSSYICPPVLYDF